MGHLLNEFFHDWKIYALLGLATLAGLNIMDIISYMLMGNGFFNLWVVKSTIGSVVVGAIVYGLFLFRRDKKTQQLGVLLPALMVERRTYFEKMVAADQKFQTFCHECRYYDNGRRRCLLRLHGRLVWIKLQPEDVFSYCLYWNLEDHPILPLTEQVKDLQEEQKLGK